MSKVKFLILILAVMLVCSGVAYASWTEQVQLQVNAKTAFTKLSISDVQVNGARVDSSLGSQAAVFFEDIAPGETATVNLTFKNTGTIPIDITKVVLSSVGGYSKANKNKLQLKITAYVNGTSILSSKKNVSKWSTAGTATATPTELSVLGTVLIIAELKYLPTGNANETVTFILTPGYTRFNSN